MNFEPAPPSGLKITFLLNFVKSAQMPVSGSLVRGDARDMNFEPALTIMFWSNVSKSAELAVSASPGRGEAPTT